MNRDATSVEVKNTSDLQDINMNRVAVVPRPEERYNAMDNVVNDEVLKNLIDVHFLIKGENLVFCHHAESDIMTNYRRELLK